jgi:hypothetical protein
MSESLEDLLNRWSDGDTAAGKELLARAIS